MARPAACEPEPLGIMARPGVVPRSCSAPLSTSCSDLPSTQPEPLASTPRRLYSEIKPDSRGPRSGDPRLYLPRQRRGWGCHKGVHDGAGVIADNPT